MKSAYSHALEALARRSYAVRELERWLSQRGHERDAVDGAVAKLLELGLLNDLEFARSRVRSLALGKGASRRRIAAELARKGVARETVDAAIAEVAEDEELDESAIVEAAALKKLKSLARYDRDVQRQRLFGYLSRRGYDLDVVKAAVKRVLG